jgi:hypothetical protein
MSIPTVVKAKKMARGMTAFLPAAQRLFQSLGSYGWGPRAEAEGNAVGSNAGSLVALAVTGASGSKLAKAVADPLS